MKDLTQKVLALVEKIPKGKITTYKEIAKALGNEKLARAVGNACNSNEQLVIIPCHRVIMSNGLLGGYKEGKSKKEKLLMEEGLKIKNHKIENYEKHLHYF